MSIYYTTNPRTHETVLEKPFYRLGLLEKYTVISELQDAELLTDALLISLANAILQHSSDQMKKDCPCRSIRRLPPEAKLADLRHKLKDYPDLAGLSLFAA